MNFWRRWNDMQVFVRWWDGYFEEFDVEDVRFGGDILWMRLTNGQNRHVPTRHVRWFSTYPESHEPIRNKG